MTTRLYAGFIQRAVTVDTHCWMWVLHLITLSNQHIAFNFWFCLSLPPPFSHTLLSSQPWSGSWLNLSCKTVGCSIFSQTKYVLQMRITKCVLCLFTRSSTYMLTSVITSSNGYLMFCFVFLRDGLQNLPGWSVATTVHHGNVDFTALLKIVSHLFYYYCFIFHTWFTRIWSH